MKKHDVGDFFDSLSFTNRKEYRRWITEAKKEQTRAARLTKSIDMMRRGIRTPRGRLVGVTVRGEKGAGLQRCHLVDGLRAGTSATNGMCGAKRLA